MKKTHKTKSRKWHDGILKPRREGAFEMKTRCDNYEVINEETQ